MHVQATPKDIATLHCGAFELPVSSLMSEQGQAILKQQAAEQKALSQKNSNSDLLSPATPPSREQQRQTFYKTEDYQRLREDYPVEIQLDRIGGVDVEIITPKAGVSKANTARVLINFHGGSFMSGSRISSQIESIPLVALGRIKVVSVDYRLYPEHRYPAATDDAVAVYKALLDHYPPSHIGIFGTSSGAALCAQTIVQLQALSLPLPCAIAMIACGAAKREGDSVAMVGPIVEAQMGVKLKEVMALGYYEGIDMNDPHVTPALSQESMSAFPPTLLAASTRDFLLSSVLATHRALVQQNIDTELHMWEGLGHFFHANLALPETRELHLQTLRFFDKHFAVAEGLS